MESDVKYKKFVCPDTLEEYKYYTVEEIYKNRPLFDQATELWHELALTYNKHKSKAITRDDIYTYVVLPKKRKPKKFVIVYAPPVKGRDAKRKSVGKVLELLRNNGIECWYNRGGLMGDLCED